MLKLPQKPTRIPFDPYRDYPLHGQPGWVERWVLWGVLMLYGLGVLEVVVGRVWWVTLIGSIMGSFEGFILWMMIPLLVRVLTLWTPSR